MTRQGLTNMVRTLARQAGIEPPTIESTVHTPTLACATFHKIVVHPDLLSASPDEVNAVLGHEIGHIKHRHALIRLLMVVLIPAEFLACIFGGHIVVGVIGSAVLLAIYRAVILVQEMQADAFAAGTLKMQYGLARYLSRGRSWSSKIRLRAVHKIGMRIFD